MSRVWVVKAGSNLVLEGGPLLVLSWMQQVAALRREHSVRVVWVTSGAIALAREAKSRPHSTLAHKQALSAIGQPRVMNLYNAALDHVGLGGAQVLLTSDDLAEPGRKANFKRTMRQLLRWGIVPVLNENDAVGTEEITFGDNDSLSARVAASLRAERLVILTDVEGLLSADPRLHPDAQRVPRVAEVTDALVESVSPSGGSQRGTGGMRSKLLAARIAARVGVPTWLVKGDLPRALVALAGGETVGTHIGPEV